MPLGILMEISVKNRLVSQKGQISVEFVISIVFILGMFIYCLFIFQDRSEMNLNFAQTWSAQDTANRIARNINNVYLMDTNSVIADNIYWQGTGKRVDLSNKSIQIWFGDTFADAFVSTSSVRINVSEFNGLIYFKRTSNGVDVNYS